MTGMAQRRKLGFLLEDSLGADLLTQPCFHGPSLKAETSIALAPPSFHHHKD